MCLQCQPADEIGAFAVPVTRPGVPLAGPIPDDPGLDDAPAGEDEDLDRPPPSLPPLPGPHFPPHLKVCGLDLRDGCWMLSVNLGGGRLVGTLRVDRGTGHLIVSGDLYRDPGPVIHPAADDPDDPPATGGLPRPPGITSTAGAIAAASASGDLHPFPFLRRIPVYPRANYHSYLKATSVRVPVVAHTPHGCRVTMTMEQFRYTQPPAGTFKGSFPATASRTLVFDMARRVGGPILLPPGPGFTGRVLENGAEIGTVSIRWASRFFRRAKVEIDVLTGAVRAEPVPAPSGTGTEWFDSVFAKIGWDLTVVSDETAVPVPTGVNPTNCWSSADLHALMLARRNPAVDLDAEWYMHLMFVPAKLGCGRGVMYDMIDVPREGVASFSDDGYPTSDSSNFGAAADQKQRDVPRAFLRSACHEITHGFNQIHQEQETAADNSIMTTTPSVADVLGGPTTGAPGVFPDQINIGHNLTVRNHLVHMPDPVIRPGGWPFASWFGGSVPQSVDRAEFDGTELTLTVTAEHDRIVLGEPVAVSWALENASSVALQVPSDVSAEGLFATVYVTDPRGTTRASRTVAVVCDHVSLQPLDPGESTSASQRVYWSTEGFAFERPGQHTVTVVVQWSAGGRSIGAEGSCPVWVDFPANDAENAAASLLMHPDVGLWVSLGGGADHLTEATTRINLATGGASGRGDTRAEVTATADSATASGAPRALRGFAPLLPSRSRATKRPAKSTRAKKRSR